MPKNRNSTHNSVKQILEHKVNVLSKIGQERNQHGWNNYKENNLHRPSIYLRYKHLYNNEMQQEEQNLFKSNEEEVYKNLNLKKPKKHSQQQEEEDDFFIDPEKEQTKQSKQQQSNNYNKNKKNKKIINNKFKEWDEKSFKGENGEMIVLDFNDSNNSKKRKHLYGPEFSTPPKDLQKKLDPKNWQENVNFIPIEPKKNKIKKLKK
ncbi:hypothetical protein ABK040_002431 [Willaertia magna]